MEKHYTVKEVSELLGMAEITIRQWIQKGRLKSVKLGSARRIKESDLKEFLKE